MSTKLDRGVVSHADAFSIATLLYARLRRVSGRVIDVMYLVENPSYARQMAELALSTEDAELIRLVSRLDSVMDVFNYEETAVIENLSRLTRHDMSWKSLKKKSTVPKCHITILALYDKNR